MAVALLGSSGAAAELDHADPWEERAEAAPPTDADDLVLAIDPWSGPVSSAPPQPVPSSPLVTFDDPWDGEPLASQPPARRALDVMDPWQELASEQPSLDLGDPWPEPATTP